MAVCFVLTVFTVILFELSTFLGIAKDAMRIVALSQESMQILKSSEIGDLEKEAVVRLRSAQIFKVTLRCAAKFVPIALALYSLFLIWFPGLRAALLESLVSPLVAAVLIIATFCYAQVRKAILM